MITIMGRKSIRNEKEIVSLYRRYRKLTKNYKDISKKLLIENPQILMIIRLACGLSQREFSRKIGYDRSALVHSEIGISRKMKTSNAEKIYHILSNDIEAIKFTENIIIKNYRRFIRQAFEGQPSEKLRKIGRGAMKFKKPTDQEKIIGKTLENLGISFEKEGILTLDEMDFVFEFLIPNSKNPEIVIECKNIKTEEKRNLKIIGYRIAYEIGYKSYLIKKKFPETKIILVINHKHEKMPNRVIKILENETNYLIINYKKNELISLFKKCLDSGQNLPSGRGQLRETADNTL